MRVVFKVICKSHLEHLHVYFQALSHLILFSSMLLESLLPVLYTSVCDCAVRIFGIMIIHTITLALLG